MVRKGGKNGKNCLRERLRNCFARPHCGTAEAPLSKRGRMTGRVKVCRVTGDRKVCARMASMGLYPGVEADVICADNGSRCVLKVAGGTISLDNDISDNIYVSSL